MWFIRKTFLNLSDCWELVLYTYVFLIFDYTLIHFLTAKEFRGLCIKLRLREEHMNFVNTKRK